MNSSRPFEFVSIVLIVSCLSSISYGQGLLAYDGAFSPNGTQIALGTGEGFHLLDRSSREQTFFRPVENGVRFLKWSPDGKQVLLVSWKNEEIPLYSVLDLEQNRIRCSFREEFRWYYYHAFNVYKSDDLSEIGDRLYEGIHPISVQLGNTANGVFSPDGNELAFITKNGDIQIRKTGGGEISRSFPFPNHHLIALGYPSTGEQIWASEYKWDSIKDRTGYLYYIQSQNGQMLREVRLDPSGYSTRPVYVYAIRSDSKYALANSVVEYTGSPGGSGGGSMLESSFVVDMENERVLSPFMEGGDMLGVPRVVGIFGLDDRIFGLMSSKDLVLDFYESDLEKIQKKSFPFNPDYFQLFGFPLLAQPLSPDGKEFVMIANGSLFIFDNDTGTIEEVDLETTGVENPSLHEAASE